MKLMIAALVSTLASFSGPPGESGQEAAPCDGGSYGVLVMAHGGDDGWNREVSRAIRAVELCAPVEIAFGMADRATLQESVTEIEKTGVRRIIVVRLFVSGESFLPQTEYLLGLRDDKPEFLMDSAVLPGAPVVPVAHESKVVITRPGLADAEVAGEILIDRARNLLADPRGGVALIIAHGMGDAASNRRLISALEGQASRLRDELGFAEVAVETLREDWEGPRRHAEHRIRDRVRNGAGRTIVIPFRVAGFGPYAEVLEGLEYIADGVGLLPHPVVGEWIRQQAELAAREAGWAQRP